MLADISSNEVTVPVAVRAEQSWTVLEMKEAIAEVGSEPFMNCSEGRGEGGRGRERKKERGIERCHYSINFVTYYRSLVSLCQQ